MQEDDPFDRIVKKLNNKRTILQTQISSKQYISNKEKDRNNNTHNHHSNRNNQSKVQQSRNNNNQHLEQRRNYYRRNNITIVEKQPQQQNTTTHQRTQNNNKYQHYTRRRQTNNNQQQQQQQSKQTNNQNQQQQHHHNGRDRQQHNQRNQQHRNNNNQQKKPQQTKPQKKTYIAKNSLLNQTQTKSNLSQSNLSESSSQSSQQDKFDRRNKLRAQQQSHRRPRGYQRDKIYDQRDYRRNVQYSSSESKSSNSDSQSDNRSRKINDDRRSQKRQDQERRERRRDYYRRPERENYDRRQRREVENKQERDERRDRRERRQRGPREVQRQPVRMQERRQVPRRFNDSLLDTDSMDESSIMSSREVRSQQQRYHDRRKLRNQTKQSQQQEQNYHSQKRTQRQYRNRQDRRDKNNNSNQQNNQNNNQQNSNNNNRNNDPTNNRNDNNRNDNNRNNKNQRRQHHRDLKYRNQCQKYLRNYQRLQQNQQQLGIEIKNLKKYVLGSEIVKTYDQKPKQISVLKCLDYPAIFFEYLYKRQKRYMQIKDLNRGYGPKIYEFYSIIKKIYDMHYYSIDIQYEESILQFVKAKATEHNIRLALNKRDNRKDQGQKRTSLMFYYCIDQRSVVQISFFDYIVKQVNLGQKYVKSLRSIKKSIDQKHFQIFDKFLKSAKGNDQLDIVNFGQQQVQSDHQIANNRTNLHINLTNQMRKVQRRIQQILTQDITELQDQLEEKNQQQLQLIQTKSNDTNKIERLGQQVEKLQRDIENFKSVKQDVQKQLKDIRFKRQKTQQHYQSLNLSLKRLIFAQKQLTSDLPILGKKQQIFDLLDKNNLIILEGQTGSGKSTQLPQILCEYYKLFENPNVLPVLVTQPRKIATRSLAQRVAEELQQKGGNFVDYVASSGKMHHPKAKIVFKLDRLVLDQLVESPTLDDYSCLVIDEAHERTISIDVILGLVKDLLTKRNGFKVIITSASMEISLFEKYFKKKTLKVSGRMYPVTIKYLPSKEEQMVKKIERAIDQQLLTQRNMLKDKYKGHILVFCADTSEIQTLAEIFKKKLNHNVFMVIPLHGKLTPEQQKKAFAKTKQHKLIFASRIAETAITIDGIKVVIDPGWDRQMQYDQKTKFSSMKLTQISQSSAKQRAGRAGRTQQGFCFRLYSQQQFKTRRFNKLPQIKNIALQTLILRLKTLGIDNVSTFDYIQKPDEQGMKTSTEVLKMIGCLEQCGKITSIGRFLVKIPIEPFLARAIIEGVLMQKALTMKEYEKLDRKHRQLTEPVIQILCMILSAGNLFRITENFKQLGDYAKYKHFSHEKGDFFFLKNIFDQFKIINNYDRRQLNDWLQKSFLIKKTLLQVKDLVKQIKSIIKQFHIDEKQMKIDIFKCKTKLEKYTTQEDRILSCLTTCFAANLCLYSGHPQIGYTYMSLQKIVTIYGTSCLSLLGICPKWVLAYDFYESNGKLYCKVANQIDYDFLLNTVEDYVIEKYKINELRNSNPFYKQINIELQTLILQQLKESYNMRQRRIEKQTQFLKKLNLTFNELQNKVQIFIKCDQKLQKQKQQGQKQLQNYIELLRKKAKSKYVHNYIGNIYVVIGNGFQIENIEFKISQKVYQISNLDEDTFSQIRDYWSQTSFVQAFNNNKIKIYLDDDVSIQYLDNFLQYLVEKQQKKIVIRKQFSDKRKKVPQTKIYLHWWAGKSQRDNVLLQFFSNFSRDSRDRLSNEDIIDVTLNQERYLSEAFQNLKLASRRRDIFGIGYARLPEQIRQLASQAQKINGLKLTKNKNGINIYTRSLDEIDLLKFFNKLIITNNISHHFELPKYIKKFREAERPQCQWKDSKWIQEIQKLLSQITDKKQPCIRVWGYGIRPKQGQRLTQLQKTFRIDMKAEIKTFDTGLLQKMKQKFDNKTNVLGYQKLHVTSVFSQSVVGISDKAFGSLKDEFQYNTQNFLKEYPGLNIDYFVRQVRKNDKKSKVYVKVSSQNRQHILKPVRVLNNLFTPKYITLSDIEFRFLNNNQGDRILEDIQIMFDYKIYFGFDKYQRKVKLYCHQSLQNQIQTVLREKLATIKYHDEAISYRGKNLKKIQSLLKDKIKKIDDQNGRNKNKKFLSYEIIFSFRKIKITADIITFNEVKKQIMNVKIQEKDKDCQICFQQMLSPYKLLNCKHSFCWACLSNSIKEFKFGQKMELRCTFTSQDQKGDDVICNSMINIYDISKILSEQELYQIFDIHISKFVDKHPEKYKRCPSPDCQKIFDIKQIQEENQIDCQLCGKHLCLKCQVSHKNYTCQEWKQMLNLSDQHLKKMGIIKCPKCGTGIQRNGGCYHMTCRCKAHVCWLCSKLFQRQKECYDHLAKDHHGIFPNNPNI